MVARKAVGTYLTEGLILYLLVSNAVRSTRTLNRVVWILIIAGSLLGAISIYQELTHTYTNNYGGLAQVDRVDSGGGSTSPRRSPTRRSCDHAWAGHSAARIATPKSWSS